MMVSLKTIELEPANSKPTGKRPSRAALDPNELDSPTTKRSTDNVGMNSARVRSLFDQDPLGTKLMQDRYDAFMRIVRQWRNLKQLKRGGCGHEPNGILGTKPGELALLCQAGISHQQPNCRCP